MLCCRGWFDPLRCGQLKLHFFGDQQTAFRFIYGKEHTIQALCTTKPGSTVLCDCDRPAQKTAALVAHRCSQRCFLIFRCDSGATHEQRASTARASPLELGCCVVVVAGDLRECGARCAAAIEVAFEATDRVSIYLFLQRAQIG
jgi:hypothetical protein